MRMGYPIIALVAALLLAGCDQSKPPLPAKQPATVLMVTWLVPGQPPQTTQTDIATMPDCLKAKDAALAAGEAAKAERGEMNNADKATASAQIRAAGGIVAGLSPEQERLFRGVALPQVSAYCINK